MFSVNTDGPETLFFFFPSQEEALQAFIQPETLDGPNQYFCERCQKKCDARKVSGWQMFHGGRDTWRCCYLPACLSCLIVGSLRLHTGAEISALPLPADAPAEAV